MTIPPPLPEELVASLPEAIQLYLRQIEAFAAQLANQVVALKAQVAQLEAKLNQNSSNSSRPPSSDGPQHKRGVPRQPGQRRRGGQTGHAKQERVILPPDHTLDHKPSQCGRCGITLTGDDPDPMIELPGKLRLVTHHRRHSLDCPNCRARTTAAPVAEAINGFGPRIQAATSYFSGVGRLSKRSIARLFADLYGIPMALGTISKLEVRTSHALDSIHAEASTRTHAHLMSMGTKPAGSKAQKMPGSGPQSPNW